VIATARQMLTDVDAGALRRVATHMLRLSSVPEIKEYLQHARGGMARPADTVSGRQP
jgi:hypothetical protein